MKVVDGLKHFTLKESAETDLLNLWIHGREDNEWNSSGMEDK